MIHNIIMEFNYSLPYYFIIKVSDKIYSFKYICPSDFEYQYVYKKIRT